MVGKAEYHTLHLMTIGEIAMVRPYFHDTVEYFKVWIHCDSWIPFELQSVDGMTPGNDIYILPEKYESDFSKATNINHQQLFMHEFTHVWQHQKGMNTKLRGMYSWVADYTYNIGSPFISYSMEQQAQMISDYWTISEHGYDRWLLDSFCRQKEVEYPIILRLYHETLAMFPYYEF